MSARLRPAGPLAWMARHSVAPNLLMLALILGGLMMAGTIKQEVFPVYERNRVTVSVVLPGASPQEVEQALVLPIEAALSDVPGVRWLRARAREGRAAVTARLAEDRSQEAVYDTIVQRIDQITAFPDEAEAAKVSLAAFDREVMTIQVHGQVDRMSLRMATERIRDHLVAAEGIRRAEIKAASDIEIHVEIPRARLRAYGLTLADAARTIREAARDRAGGTLETRGGALFLRIADRREAAREFALLPLIVDDSGTVVRLGDIAEIRRGFAERDLTETYRGRPALQIEVFRTGEQTPIGVADAVRRALPGALATLPEEIDATILSDRSEWYHGRMQLLIKNGLIGLVLVLGLLSLFLEYRLAFWVAVGIPTAFLGTFLLLPYTGASLNMVTMFAFILALGLVVDDAIVVGENIYEYLERGMSRIDAAIQGARDIAVPLSFSILTNIVAFLPLAMIPGWFGKFFIWIPVVVACTFLLSWVEALFVLPAHLAGVRRRPPDRPVGALTRLRRRISAGLGWAIHRLYAPLLRVALAWRYTTVALLGAALMVVMAPPLSGQMGFSLFPEMPRDRATARVTLPVGAPHATAVEVRDRMVAAAERVIAENGGERLAKGIATRIQGMDITMQTYLQPPDTRPISTAAFARAWRAEVGPIPEARGARYDSSWGGPGGAAALDIRLNHGDPAVLRAASKALRQALAGIPQVSDVKDDYQPGKLELAFRLTEAGRSLGLTSEALASQVRAAFHGIEAISQQDGRNEVTLRLRLPESERSSEADIETMLLQTPDGGAVPLFQVAEMRRSRSEAAITRVNGRRILTVSANVEPPEQVNRVTRALTERLLPGLVADHPGLGYSFTGRQESQRRTLESFSQVSIPLALAIIYALLAIPFRSYTLPAVVMTAIPFGFAGAVIGHWIMGMALSMVSVFGVIALSGVVINAGIVMIDHAEKTRRAGATPFEAIWRAGQRRFRPILLTSLTTFGGLAPMIFETARAAQFLVPMAVSLGYGIVFATVVVLFLIPALYLILDDIRWLANPPRPDPEHRTLPEMGGSPGRLAAE